MSAGNALISEEALIQDFCQRMGLLVQPIFRAMGAHGVEDGRVWMHEWSPEHMSVVLNDPKKVSHKKYINRIVFSDLYYDPNSHKEEGEPKIARGSAHPVPNGSKTIIPPDPNVDLFVDLSHTDELTTRNTVTLNLSSTISSTTEVKGEYGGVSLTQTIALTLGISATKENEKTHKQTDHVSLDDVKIPAGKALHQTVTKETVIVDTPFKMRAFPDFVKIKLDFEDNAGKGYYWPSKTIMYKHAPWGGKHEIEVEGFLGLQRLWNGGDWRVREMRAFRTSAAWAARKAMNEIAKKDTRAVELEGINHDVFEDNLTIHPNIVARP